MITIKFCILKYYKSKSPFLMRLNSTKNLFIILSVSFNYAIAQGPWDNDIRIAFSNDGTTFGSSSFLLDSADVPSIAVLDDSSLIATFQWFAGQGNQAGKVATITSNNNGTTWSNPTLANFINKPSGYIKPVDPTIINIGGGMMRMYFSMGKNIITDSTLDVFSATSTDGINFTFDTTIAAFSDSIEIIEPAVDNINGTWHCVYAIGHPWLGATHASSPNGSMFNYAPHINSDTAHSWIGNFLNNGSNTRFYGSTPNEIWWASTTNGNTYGPYNATNIKGVNPAVAKLPDSTFVMIYIEKNAPPLGIREFSNEFKFYPNPFSSQLTIQLAQPLNDATLILSNCLGQTVKQMKHLSGTEFLLKRDGLVNGLYFFQLMEGDKLIGTRKVMISDIQ